MLDPTELRLHKSESEVLRFAQGEGFLQMSGTHALVLVDEVLPDRRARRATVSRPPARGRGALEHAEEDTEERRQAERDKRRYEAFSKLAGGADVRRVAAAATGVAAAAAATLLRVDERALAERLITYDTSQPDGIRACAGFIKGWLEAREIDVHDSDFGELPVLTADVGPRPGRR